MPTRYRGTETEVRALNAFINLARAVDSLTGRLSADLEGRGVTLAQFGVLEAIHHLGPLCQKELAAKLLRSGGNVTVVVDNLEKHGWVRRERQANDRRLIRIHLTEAGRALIERVFPKHVETLVEQFSALEPQEQEELRRLCRKLGRANKKSSEEGKREETDNVASASE